MWTGARTRGLASALVALVLAVGAMIPAGALASASFTPAPSPGQPTAIAIDVYGTAGAAEPLTGLVVPLPASASSASAVCGNPPAGGVTVSLGDVGPGAFSVSTTAATAAGVNVLCLSLGGSPWEADEFEDVAPTLSVSVSPPWAGAPAPETVTLTGSTPEAAHLFVVVNASGSASCDEPPTISGGTSLYGEGNPTVGPGAFTVSLPWVSDAAGGFLSQFLAWLATDSSSPSLTCGFADFTFPYATTAPADVTSPLPPASTAPPASPVTSTSIPIPKATVRLMREGLTTLERRGLSVRLSCSAACHAVVEATLDSRAPRSHGAVSHVVLGSAMAATTGAGSAEVRIPLTPAGLRALRGSKRIAITVDGSVRGESGGAASGPIAATTSSIG